MDSIKYDVFKIKSEEVKFNAFFQYLKSFSEAGLDTLQKLENDFTKEMKRKTKQVEKLSLMKNILSSYEIFILEIKDSCDFVQIPEFGYCIGKAFVQLIKIIKWFLKAWLQNSRNYQKVIQKQQTQSINQTEQQQNQANVCAFCEQLIRSNPHSRDGRNKRKGVAINDINHEMRNAKKNHYSEMNQIMQFKEQVLEKYTLKDITSRRYICEPGDIDILNKKHMAMKLETSDNGTVLEQILNEFNLKTESIARFVANTQAMCVQDFKMSSQIDYSQFQEEMRARIAYKLQEARQKLKNLVSNRIAQFERVKRSKMVDKQLQVEMRDHSEKQRLEQKVKLITASYQKLKNQLESQRSLNENLKKLLQSKSVEFQQQFLNYRKNAIVTGEKGRQHLKSLKSFKQLLEDKDQSKEGQLQKKSRSIIAPIEFQSKQKFPKKFVTSSKQGHYKRNSIKFTLGNDSSDEQKGRDTIKIGQISIRQVLLNKVQVQTQTDPIINDIAFPANRSSVSANKKFYIVNREGTLDQKSKNKKLLQKTSVKRTIPISSNYSHISSKINVKSQKIQIKKETRKARTYVDQYMKSISKQNSRIQQTTISEVKCYKLRDQPCFLKAYHVQFTKADVMNLYVNYKNAHNYECLLYRNLTLNDRKPVQKRAKTYVINVNRQSPLDQIDQSQCQPTEIKLIKVLYKQLAGLKKKEKGLHNEIKLILRSPTEVGQNLDVVYLQNYRQSIERDIELSELKKMVSLILKYHTECMGQQREVICNHLVDFFQKIGISIAQFENYA